ncbi:hypothetical protein [Patiriisocius hiemis]|uniref:Uncharacterized protein n=1 Tax=Patiriisocius hiemis TaxID=3075604 RepID=A0ABU2YEH1_9FLAO|nr:hypothetical protein [Constantimarinum sp. W242]MDT0556594.1 hypothetical protein [Constantimarinum sp. W242]
MDQLELLKEKWKNTEQQLPTLSYDDIYKMLLKKSSSIVKWIFFISIAEILFWTALSFFIPESSKAINEELGLKNIFLVVNIINYSVFIVFIYLFYRNYQKIQVTDTSRQLMKNILNTRKTVKYFVVYNVGASVLALIGINIYYYFEKDRLFEIMKQNFDGYASIPPETFTAVFFGSQAIVGILFIGFLLLFYRLIYGILLKRLKRNYRELKKMEV